MPRRRSGSSRARSPSPALPSAEGGRRWRAPPAQAGTSPWRGPRSRTSHEEESDERDGAQQHAERVVHDEAGLEATQRQGPRDDDAGHAVDEPVDHLDVEDLRAPQEEAMERLHEEGVVEL